MLAANGSNGLLATCAIRPSGIFGEGDATFFPTLVAKARQGKLKYYIGNGKNLVEFTYAGNVAFAHLQVNLNTLCHVLALHAGCSFCTTSVCTKYHRDLNRACLVEIVAGVHLLASSLFDASTASVQVHQLSFAGCSMRLHVAVIDMCSTEAAFLVSRLAHTGHIMIGGKNDEQFAFFRTDMARRAC